ncbi:predicted protein [Histoplasma capsulatum var. duboisii H88]|uniref:Predicted protein n=1 Tax=Ajellomyces capsulatus (strain H88) TaxID=544711 RepID=F0UT29_AJEC8|nr:predicted protein [Histoplasma capsulatum var. duboisii H88]
MYHETLAGSKGRRCQLAKGEKKRNRQHAPVVKARLLRPQSALAGWAQGGRSNLAGTAVNRRRHHRCQPGNTNGASDTHTADGNTNTNTTTYSPPKATWLQAPNTLETNVSQAILRPTRTKYFTRCVSISYPCWEGSIRSGGLFHDRHPSPAELTSLRNCGLANPAREALMLAGLVLVETILA